jgi:endothelin-converting enzyme/putative endopeptidase
MKRLLPLLFLLAATTATAQNFVDAGDGVRIWYTEVGTGSPVIVIHGGPGMDHESLAGDLVPLTAHHRLIEYDQRGGGRSTLPADTALLTIDHHVRDLEALRQHLGLDKVTLLAHSFGPAIAALYAIRYPEHVERMIFLGPIPPRKGKFFEEFGAALGPRLTDAQRKRGSELQAQFATAADIAAVCREYWSIMTPPRLAKSASASVVKSDLCAGPPEGIRYGMTKTNSATFASLGDWNWTADLAHVKAPVLIIHGEEDAIPMSMVAEWATALPNARLIRLPNTAHFPHAEQPAAVFAAIETFLQPERGVFAGDIDKTVDACTNFFDYANGAWRKANPIPASMQRWSRRWAAGEASKEQLRELLDDESKRNDWAKGSIDQQISDFYGSCMDQSRIDALGIKPIEPLLARIKAIKSSADLQKEIAELHELQMFAPFGITSTPDNHNPSQVIARVFASGLGLPDRDYYFKPDQRFADAREKYVAHVAKMFELSGYTPPAAKKASETVFAIEKRLARAHLDNVALRDPAETDHKMTVAALQKMTPHFDWTRYLDRAGIAPADLNVDQPEFMRAAEKELTSTPLAAWKTYLTWNVINNAAQNLSEPIAAEDWAFFQKTMRGAKEMKPRWKRCVESEDALLGEALGRRYVERYFPPEAKARMQEMVKNLLAAMGDTIRGLEWMGPETKQHALEKLATFNPKVGYPDKWKDYSKVDITSASYWQNVVGGLKFASADDHALIGHPIDRGRWGLTPPTSDAYYNPLLNEIVFPAGILRPPAFDVNAADAVNYGAIGVVIGHEISHGFDDQGAQYDATGKLNNWWTAEDLKRFRERTDCVVNQFESYFIEPGIHHNGKLVLGESIGDLAGAKIAWLRRRSRRSPPRRSTASRPRSSSLSPGVSSAATKRAPRRSA